MKKKYEKAVVRLISLHSEHQILIISGVGNPDYDVIPFEGDAEDDDYG